LKIKTKPKTKHGSVQATQEVVECALALACGVQTPERHYSERTLDTTSKKFRHGVGLREVLVMAARSNGESIEYGSRDVKRLIRAAFRPPVRLSATSSFIDAPTLFSNVANKLALDSFNAVENAWERIASVVPASDFKETTSFSLTGDLTFEKVPPTGMLKHGTLGEEVYHNQVESYGKLVGLDRRDIINDDTSALNRVPKRLGRGGALKLNEEFWQTFLANSGFFTSARGNFGDGADTAFGADSLALADVLFRTQTDPDGKPLGATPALLLVPPGLRIAALRLMKSQQVMEDSSLGADNPWAGAFEVVSSQYLSNSSFTGASSKAWYLLADPNDLPVIEVAFLDGRRTPMIDTAEPTPDYLGVVYQAVFDFGVSLQEYRGGVKMKGEV
jgi:hypothetical protein